MILVVIGRADQADRPMTAADQMPDCLITVVKTVISDEGGDSASEFPVELHDGFCLRNLFQHCQGFLRIEKRIQGQEQQAVTCIIVQDFFQILAFGCRIEVGKFQ